METLVSWLTTFSYGLPNWGWALMVVFSLIEMVLGNSKDERWRSIAGSMRNAAGMVLGIVLRKVPMGYLVLQVLQMLKVIPATDASAQGAVPKTEIKE